VIDEYLAVDVLVTNLRGCFHLSLSYVGAGQRGYTSLDLGPQS
jgi:hypothetical protein